MRLKFSVVIRKIDQLKIQAKKSTIEFCFISCTIDKPEIFHTSSGQDFRAALVFSPLNISSVPLSLKAAIT